MLVLPIINKNNIMNVEVSLKTANRIRQKVSFEDFGESEIVVNNEKISDSIYKDSKEKTAPIDFIRNKSIIYKRPYLLTTRYYLNSELYDIYEVQYPNDNKERSLDILYSKAIKDINNNIPNKNNRGRYISFDDIGLSDSINDEVLTKLQKIVTKEKDPSKWKELLEKENISYLYDILDNLNLYDYSIIKDSEVSEESISDSIKALSTINTRDYKNLKKYYNMAKSNTETYIKLSYINRILYGKSLKLIQMNNNQKKLIKRIEEAE